MNYSLIHPQLTGNWKYISLPNFVAGYNSVQMLQSLVLPGLNHSSLVLRRDHSLPTNHVSAELCVPCLHRYKLHQHTIMNVLHVFVQNAWGLKKQIEIFKNIYVKKRFVISIKSYFFIAIKPIWRYKQNFQPGTGLCCNVKFGWKGLLCRQRLRQRYFDVLLQKLLHISKQASI